MDLKRIKSNLENNKIISIKMVILFAFFQMLMLWIFDAYSFFEIQHEPAFFYSEVFLSVFFFQFVFTTIIKILKLNERTFRVSISLSFIVSSMLSSIICWWVAGGTFSILLIVVSSFIIPSLFPAIGTFLKLLIDDANTIFTSNENLLVTQDSDENKTLLQNDLKSTDFDNKTIETQIEKPIQFVLENENGKILLDIPIKNIICFEANDNYVVTYYLDREKRLKKSMERISLKKIEEIVEGLNVENFTRVHKSYFINKSFLEEIKGKAQAHKLKLYHLDLVIPVSRAYSISKLKEF